jgi:hypothetical protein
MKSLRFRIPLQCTNCKTFGYEYIYWNGQQFITDSITPCCDKRKYEIIGQPEQYVNRDDIYKKHIYVGDMVSNKEGVIGSVFYNKNMNAFQIYFGGLETNSIIGNLSDDLTVKSNYFNIGTCK